MKQKFPHMETNVSPYGNKSFPGRELGIGKEQILLTK